MKNTTNARLRMLSALFFFAWFVAFMLIPLAPGMGFGLLGMTVSALFWAMARHD